MRKFRELFFFANVISSAITTSFQQVHLGHSEAPSELQVTHSEQVALERRGALCRNLEGVECRRVNPVRKHRTTDSSTSTHWRSRCRSTNRQDVANERVVRRRPSKPRRLRVLRARS